MFYQYEILQAALQGGGRYLQSLKYAPSLPFMSVCLCRVIINFKSGVKEQTQILFRYVCVGWRGYSSWPASTVLWGEGGLNFKKVKNFYF